MARSTSQARQTSRPLPLAPGFLKSSITSGSYTITAPPTHIISTFAGSANGLIGRRPEVQPPVPLLLIPWAIAFDAAGNTFIADRANTGRLEG